MALATYPSVSSPVKSVQRGSAGGAGTITITAVDIAKSFVNIFGTTSSGTVAASFGLNAPGAGNATLVGVGVRDGSNTYSTNRGPNGSSYRSSVGLAGGPNSQGWTFTMPVNAGTAPTPNAGSNNLVAAVVQGYLSNSTSLVVSGACRYEVVEFN